jgi:hypothetical protein
MLLAVDLLYERRHVEQGKSRDDMLSQRSQPGGLAFIIHWIDDLEINLD